MGTLVSAETLELVVARCRAGDDRAWATLVESFQGLVYSIPRRMGLPEDDCADVFQATFLALHRSLDRIESPRTLPKWLSVTASRESLRVRRIAAASLTRSSDEMRGLEEILADEERSAEASALDACNAHALRAATARLGARCRDLIGLLYFEEDVAYQEISQRLSMPVGAIGPTRARCLAKLRKILEGEGFIADAAYFGVPSDASYGRDP